MSGILICVLSFGVAVNTALFSVIDALLIKPLPLRSPEEVVIIGIERPSSSMFPLSPQRLADVKDADLFADVAAIAEGGEIESADANDPNKIVQVTPNFFALLGVMPSSGAASEAVFEATGEVAPAVMSHGLWHTRFGAAQSIIGRGVSLGSRRFHIVGIMPRDFEFPRGADIWTPLPPPTDQRQRNFHNLEVIGRLKPGMTIEATRARLTSDLRLQSITSYLRPSGVPELLFLFGCALVVFLTTWTQVASIRFIDTAQRASDIGLRMALGASRWAILREWLAEATIFAVVTIALALWTTPQLTRLLNRILPAAMREGYVIATDWRELAFAALAGAVGIVLTVGLPALTFLRQGHVVLATTHAAGGVSRVSGKATWALLWVQLAMTGTLLYVAGATVHTFAGLSRAPLGFEPKGLTAVSLPWGKEKLDQRLRDTWKIDEAIRRLKELRGVRAVSGAGSVPFQKWKIGGASAPTRDQNRDSVATEMKIISPGHLRTLGARLRSGRDLSDTDRRGAPMVCLVNETLEKVLTEQGWNSTHLLYFNGLPFRVVGTVADMRDVRPDTAAAATIYVSTQQWAPASALIVRASNEDPALARRVADTISSAWGTSERLEIVRMEDELARLTAPQRGRAVLLSGLALIAIALGAAGMYGGVSYVTRLRLRELAIRAALGAAPDLLSRRIILTTMQVACGGLASGIIAGVIGARFATTLIVGVEQVNWAALVIVAVILLVVSYLAALGPARWASHVDPLKVLRME